MPAPILVTGGTGTLGRLVVARLRAAGHDVRVLSRHDLPSVDGVDGVTGDLSTGTGIDAAVAGVDVIVHAAGTTKGDDDKARHLARAATSAGVGHLVFISVVGADRIPVESRLDRAMFGYFASKLAAEQVIAASGLPWTTLRATQFHDLMFKAVRSMTKLPLVAVPRFRFQPVDAGEVADQLVALAAGRPAGLVPDLAGPRVHSMAELVRSYLHARGRRRLVVPLHVPGKAAAAFRDGANLAPDRALGHRTWEEFLTEQIGPPPESQAPTDAA